MPRNDPGYGKSELEAFLHVVNYWVSIIQRSGLYQGEAAQILRRAAADLQMIEKPEEGAPDLDREHTPPNPWRERDTVIRKSNGWRAIVWELVARDRITVCWEINGHTWPDSIWYPADWFERAPAPILEAKDGE